MDRNDYYEGESTSLNLNQVFSYVHVVKYFRFSCLLSFQKFYLVFSLTLFMIVVMEVFQRE
jgi:hypothetical protein